MKKIVFNRHSGSVSVCTPTEWAISVMGNGGFDVWHSDPGFSDRQIASMVKRGIREDVAYRYARAMLFGGCTTAEALEILRDRDCWDGFAHELWDASDVPTDRWFRDAWRRSHNGGPIYVNLDLAKPIQFRHIKVAQELENQRRDNDLDLFLSPVEIDLSAIRQRILSARDETELRMIWPKELKNAAAVGKQTRR